MAGGKGEGSTFEASVVIEGRVDVDGFGDAVAPKVWGMVKGLKQ